MKYIKRSFNFTEKEIKYPDAKKHKYISFVKSGLRIVAFGFLAYFEIQTAAVLLLLAELLGVYEEMV
jgi:hypothetical protein